MENKELCKKYDGHQNTVCRNYVTKEVEDKLKKDNEVLKLRCKAYEMALEIMREKVAPRR